MLVMDRCRMESQRAINVRTSLTLPTTTHNLELVILDLSHLMQTYPTLDIWLFIDEWVSFSNKQSLYLTLQALCVYCQLNVNHLRTCVSLEKPNTRACLTLLIMKVSGMQSVHIQASGILVNNVDPGACVCVQLVFFFFNSFFFFSGLASSALQTH
jgi:hypothetical protein